MRTIILLVFLMGSYVAFSQGGNEDPDFVNSDNLKIKDVKVKYDDELAQLVWSFRVNGSAGKSVPKAVGNVHGAPVLGYVFPTSLKSTDVGFGDVKGVTALALTSHPDFDDTPLWDENNDSNYLNDGVVWHAHWVVLTSDERVPGGLSVLQFEKGDPGAVLPPTNPGMPMYMDSPGFNVLTRANEIKVVIPVFRINNKTSFQFDGVTAYMEVNTEIPDYPMLGVYTVYDVASGDLSMPYEVTSKSVATK